MKKVKKILIADDDFYVHELLSAVLDSNDFKIIHAFNGRETLELVDAEPPDIIVLDIIMPFIDGRDICRDIKKNRRTQHIQILMLSGKDNQWDRILGLELGADNYMTKPFSPNHLFRTIKKMC